jgi:L-lysine 6-transaminase
MHQLEKTLFTDYIYVMIPPSQVHAVLKKYTIGDGHGIVVDTDKSKGSWIVDAVTGRQYLDCYSQFASQPVGWNHPSLKFYLPHFIPALGAKLANSDLYTTELAEFVDSFSKVAPDFSHFFFIEGGTLGVENALKAAFDWKAQKLGLADDACVNHFDVIHLKEAFHGRSGYTMSLTNTDPNKIKWFPKFDWTRITNPKIHSETPVELLEAESLQQAENALKKGNVAAIILETIQGEGGDNHFRKEYFQDLRKLADQYEAILIFDEVQAGLGLTGKMWAYQHFDVVPDMICFGKKTQVCGFAATTRLDDVNSVFKRSSRINSTWGGNLVDMIRFSIIKKIIEKERLVENAATVGNYFMSMLKTVKGVTNVRGRGLMIAFDLETPERRDEVLKKCEDKMLVLKSGYKSIRLRPHLDFKQSEANLAVEYLNQSL